MALDPSVQKLANDELRKASGAVTYDHDALTEFLYTLMRDHLPVGVVAEVVTDSGSTKPVVYTNGWLAQYAHYLASKLRTK